MVLIAISGKKGSGKDECAKIIADRCKPLVSARIGFADALKEEIAKACGVTVQHIEKNKTLFRPMLQWWGTEFRRNQNELYWIEQWYKKCIASTADIILTPDVRFQNEAKAVKQVGGFLLRVSRHEKAAYDDRGDRHASECDLDSYRDFDFNVRNDLSIQSLGLCLDEFLLKLKQQKLIP